MGLGRASCLFQALGLLLWGLALCCVSSFLVGPHRFRFQSLPNPRFPLHSTAQKSTEREGWFPAIELNGDTVSKETLEILEATSVGLAAKLVLGRLSQITEIKDVESKDTSSPDEDSNIAALVRGRFMDLTCTAEGEEVLERMFLDQQSALIDPALQEFREVTGSESRSLDVVRGAVLIIQSLCAMGTQVGVRGPPEQLKRMVAHLDGRNDPSLLERDFYYKWDHDSVRRLKYRIDRSPALELLGRLLWKRTPKGAFDLLVQLGAWELHEDVALLRSGFPIRFSKEEEEIARLACNNTRDPDTILGTRQDLRHLKVFTIDGASASEIDDGLSVETVERPDGSSRNRIWIHIADVDRWAPRDSEVFQFGRQRVTSLYLPRVAIPMFPSSMAVDLMSLKANQDSYALSLGVELNEDGSVDADSIVMTPSIIRVTYRLTYEDANEMLEEGIGYQEEWELGALLVEATKRRRYRCASGSCEGLFPRPIPFSVVSVFPNKKAPDGLGISNSIQVAYNSGVNQSTVVADSLPTDSDESPVSASNLLVTEAMILSGECVGHWKQRVEQEEKETDEASRWRNAIRLPFRTQPAPDFKARSREYGTLMDLLEYNVGEGYCHTWYGRRFLSTVKVSEGMAPHSGLGLNMYAQWSSPIRRYSDLQVHTCIKRFLRRRKVYEIWREGRLPPPEIKPFDLGLSDFLNDDSSDSWEAPSKIVLRMLDQDVNYFEGAGLVGAARTLQRQSQQYWRLEMIQRTFSENPDKVYEAIVLGITAPDRGQHAVYVKELGLEHRFISPGGNLNPGLQIKLRVDTVSPTNGQLNFVRTLQ